MDAGQMDEVLSSQLRLRIMNALSLRPRTLGELASITGITVQGVIRHLNRLEAIGLVAEKRVTDAPKARTLYTSKGSRLGDYSTEDLIVVKATKVLPQAERGTNGQGSLEQMSGDLIVQRIRVREQAKRLGRSIDDLVDYQDALETALASLSLEEEERLILEVILTEETVQDGVKVLAKYYGIEDRRSIDKALAKARQNVK